MFFILLLFRFLNSTALLGRLVRRVLMVLGAVLVFLLLPLLPVPSAFTGVIVMVPVLVPTVRLILQSVILAMMLLMYDEQLVSVTHLFLLPCTR